MISRCPYCHREFAGRAASAINIERHLEACKRNTPEIHTTDRMVFKTCRQRWWYSSNLSLNLEPLAPVENFEFGDAFHQGHSAYYNSGLKTNDHGVTYDTFNRSMIPAVKVFEDAIKDWYGKLEENDITEETNEKFDEYLELGKSMFDMYMRFATIEDDFEVLWTERVFHIPLIVPSKNGRGKRQVVYSFRTDGLVRDSHGRLWIIELKTAANLPDKTDYLLTDDQVGGYIWCLNQLEEVKALGRIEGVIYRWARKKVPSHMKPLSSKPTLSVDKRIVTTYEIAVEDIKAHHNGKLPSIYGEFLDHLKEKGNQFVKQEYVRRNDKEIARIGEAVKIESSMMVNDPEIIRTPSSFNCNSCAFLIPCTVRWEGGDDSGILSDSFTQRKIKYSVQEEVADVGDNVHA